MRSRSREFWLDIGEAHLRLDLAQVRHGAVSGFAIAPQPGFDDSQPAQGILRTAVPLGLDEHFLSQQPESQGMTVEPEVIRDLEVNVPLDPGNAAH
jgi:hypothetical protein